MDKKQNLDLKLLLDKTEFYVDDFISGTLVLNSERPSLIEKIDIEITMVQEWKLKGSQPQSNNKYHFIVPLNLNNTKTLIPIQDCYIMPGGENKIPFKFKLAKDPCPCFEYPLNEIYGFIRYHFDIKIDSCHFKKLVWNNYLHVIARPCIIQNEKLTKTFEDTIKKVFTDLGSIIMTITISDNNLKYNSEIKADIFIDNTYGKDQIKELEIKFLRIISFFGTKQEIKYNEEYLIYTTKLPTVIMPGKKQNYECTIPLKDNNCKRYIYNNKNHNQNLYNIKQEEINYYMPTVYSDYISCKYDLQFELYLKTKLGNNNRPRIRFPIYIVHQRLSEYQDELEKAKKYNINEENNNIIHNENGENKGNNININNNTNHYPYFDECNTNNFETINNGKMQVFVGNSPSIPPPPPPPPQPPQQPFVPFLNKKIW